MHDPFSRNPNFAFPVRSNARNITLLWNGEHDAGRAGLSSRKPNFCICNVIQCVLRRIYCCCAMASMTLGFLPGNLNLIPSFRPCSLLHYSDVLAQLLHTSLQSRQFSSTLLASCIVCLQSWCIYNLCKISCKVPNKKVSDRVAFLLKVDLPCSGTVASQILFHKSYFSAVSINQPWVYFLYSLICWLCLCSISCHTGCFCLFTL